MPTFRSGEEASLESTSDVFGLSFAAATAPARAPHAHRHALLILILRGTLTCETEDGVWLVPPECAVWIPAGAAHGNESSIGIDSRALLVEPARVPPGAPTTCCTLTVTPLLRELVLRCASLPASYADAGVQSRLVTVLLDELSVAPTSPLHLPLPRDPRLRRLTTAMLAEPTAHAGIAEWAAHVAMSERSLRRLLVLETGVGFSQWRQQLHVMRAVRRLTAGASVKEVALELGYESTSAFVTMFKRIMGSPPQRFVDALSGRA